MKKDNKVKAKLTIVALGSLLAACNAPDRVESGMSTTNVPVVSQTSYVFDATAPSGVLAPDEMERLDNWFGSLGLGYGDSVYVDGSDGPARGQVAAVAGQYGLLVSDGAPVTPGAVTPGSVRVVVSRAKAHLPGCPDWSRQSQPDFNNKVMSNYGCGVNGHEFSLPHGQGDTLQHRHVDLTHMIGPMNIPKFNELHGLSPYPGRARLARRASAVTAAVPGRFPGRIAA